MKNEEMDRMMNLLADVYEKATIAIEESRSFPEDLRNRLFEAHAEDRLTVEEYEKRVAAMKNAVEELYKVKSIMAAAAFDDGPLSIMSASN